MAAMGRNRYIRKRKMLFCVIHVFTQQTLTEPRSVLPSLLLSLRSLWVHKQEVDTTPGPPGQAQSPGWR